MRGSVESSGWQTDHHVEWRWKETVIYWEWTTPGTERGYVFDGGWGVTPLETYVPTEATWDSVVPSWMAGRRAEIVERIRLSALEQMIREDDGGYDPGQEHRLLHRDR